MPFEVRQQNVSFSSQKYQDVTKSKEIVAINVLAMAVIEVKINPALKPAVTVNYYMVAANIPVFFAMFVQEAYGFDAFHEMV